MADSPNQVGPSTSGGAALVAKALGVGGTVPGDGQVAPRRGTGKRPAGLGPRGVRVLPADFPLDQLDRLAPRGTYVDLLV
ncbi:MAG: hypothetical protein M0006_14735 [Magnetospirillum sp.]|nr:hypothetical protein [Magnetospirillum sp.]